MRLWNICSVLVEFIGIIIERLPSPPAMSHGYWYLNCRRIWLFMLFSFSSQWLFLPSVMSKYLLSNSWKQDIWPAQFRTDHWFLQRLPVWKWVQMIVQILDCSAVRMGIDGRSLSLSFWISLLIQYKQRNISSFPPAEMKDWNAVKKDGDVVVGGDSYYILTDKLSN